MDKNDDALCVQLDELRAALLWTAGATRSCVALARLDPTRLQPGDVAVTVHLTTPPPVGADVAVVLDADCLSCPDAAALVARMRVAAAAELAQSVDALDKALAPLRAGDDERSAEALQHTIAAELGVAPEEITGRDHPA